MQKIIILISILFFSSCNKYDGKITLQNKAQESIGTATITICGQTMRMKDILPGKSATGSYEVKSDSSYAVTVEFKSGKKISSEVGYVTNGMDFNDEIAVTDSSINQVHSK